MSKEYEVRTSWGYTHAMELMMEDQFKNWGVISTKGPPACGGRLILKVGCVLRT